MKKQFIILALVAVSTLVRANTCTVFSPVTINNNSYGCNLTSTLTGVTGQQVTGCSFNFGSCAALSGGSLLYCNIGGNTIGTLTQTATSWICNLDANGLNTLNNCINSSSACNFGVSCSGGWSVGACTANYTCTPKPPVSVPDAASTASLLALTLAGVSTLRRKLA